MAAGKKPGPQCSHGHPENIRDGTTSLAQSPLPGALGIAVKTIAGWLFSPSPVKTGILGTLKIDSGKSEGDRIVSAAKAAAKSAAGKNYLYGGKSVEGFDCSGFVFYVYHSIFSAYQYLDTTQIEGGGSPFVATNVAKPGDLIFFPNGKNPYEVKKKNNKIFPAHVGIVIDSDSWIGSQSSTGAAIVPMNNPWWSARTKKFFRYQP